MTDIRRTLLWVVFTMSLVFLWDKWNIPTGSLRGSAARRVPRPPHRLPARPRPASVPAQAGVPQPVATAATAAAPAAAGAVPAAPAAVPAGEQVTLTTDKVKATFISQGGSLVRRNC